MESEEEAEMDPQRAGVDLDATIEAQSGAMAGAGTKFDSTVIVADVTTLRATQFASSGRSAPAEDSAAEDDYADDFECDSRPASGRAELESGRCYSDDEFESDYGDDDFESSMASDRDSESSRESSAPAPRQS